MKTLYLLGAEGGGTEGVGGMPKHGAAGMDCGKTSYKTSTFLRTQNYLQLQKVTSLLH